MDRRSLAIFTEELIVFMIPSVSFVEFNVVGRLFMSELLLLSVLPFLLLANGRKLLDPMPTAIFVAGAFWLYSQIITDLIRGTPYADLARGWSRIVFFLASFASLYLLVSGRDRLIILFCAGLAVGGLARYGLMPAEYLLGDTWKLGYGLPLTFLCVSLLYFAHWVGLDKRLLGPGLLTLGTINLYMGARSLGGVCLLASVLCFLGEFVGRRKRGLNPLMMLLCTLITGVAALIIFEIYAAAAQNGLLGEAQLERYRMQAGGNLPLIISGRSEILVSTRAIRDSPILGHGSWAKSADYTNEYHQRLEDAGLEYHPSVEDNEGLIPTHSHLFGAWVEAGIAGGAFWLLIIFITIRALGTTLNGKTQIAAVIFFIGVLFIWDIIFSPFGAERRFVNAFFITVLLESYPKSASSHHRAFGRT